MLEQIIEPTLLTQFKEALENSGNVVVTCHKSPDGDAAGSNLALKLIRCHPRQRAGRHGFPPWI